MKLNTKCSVRMFGHYSLPPTHLWHALLCLKMHSLTYLSPSGGMVQHRLHIRCMINPVKVRTIKFGQSWGVCSAQAACLKHNGICNSPLLLCEENFWWALVLLKDNHIVFEGKPISAINTQSLFYPYTSQCEAQLWCTTQRLSAHACSAKQFYLDQIQHF